MRKKSLMRATGSYQGKTAKILQDQLMEAKGTFTPVINDSRNTV